MIHPLRSNCIPIGRFDWLVSGVSVWGLVACDNILAMFEHAKLKIQRAEKHIRELYDFIQGFPNTPNFHSVSIERDASGWYDPEIVITFHRAQDDFMNQTALIIGDVCHNLRSALDVVWYEIVFFSGKQTDWTRFPIDDTPERVTKTLDAALKKEQISQASHGFVLDTIKPYREGNFRLWALHEMNIIDKHQLLIPTFPMMAVEGIRILNDEDNVVEMPVIFTDGSMKRRLDYFGGFGKNPKVMDEGRVAIGQGFNLGTPCEGQPVIPMLNAILKEVRSTIGEFESRSIPQDAP
jgi:hypothetical protein